MNIIQVSKNVIEVKEEVFSFDVKEESLSVEINKSTVGFKGEQGEQGIQGEKGEQGDPSPSDHSLLNLDDGTNPHGTTASDVGLGNVDNTSDLDKPISTATQSALDDKQNELVSGTNIKTINSESLLGLGNIEISGGGAATLSDTRENILAQTPSEATLAYATDTNQFYIYTDEWLEFSSSLNKRDGAIDIGYHQDSNLTGYGDDYITDKLIANSTIGGNANQEEGGVRVVFSQSLQRNLAQFFLGGQWRTTLTGVNIVTDIEKNPPDIEFTDFSPWVLSLITGNSDQRDPNGVPVVQNMKIDMGVFSAPLVIDGGDF
jgi:hypothetical protein